jgi:lysophosphatidate acyltransferase
MENTRAVDKFTSTLRIVAGFVYMTVLVLFFSLLCVVLLPWRPLRLRLTNIYGHLAGRGCLWLAGVRVPPDAVANIQARYPALYVANHTSLVDMFIAIWLSPTGTCGVAKREVIYYPLLGQIFAISGHLLLDRTNRDNAVEAMRRASRMVVENKFGVWMWPEGTRSRDGRLQPFKKGFAHLALATRLPIVPIALTGVQNSWKRGSMVINPCNLGVKVLPPISTAHWTVENLDAHIAEVHAALQGALPPEQQALSPVAVAPERSRPSESRAAAA